MTEYVTYESPAEMVGEYDVVVVGGGSAGVGAAVAAARHGARTLLVEQFGCLGGVGTSAMVAVWLGGGKNTSPMEPAVGGIFTEIVERMIRIGAASRPGQTMGRLGPIWNEPVYFDVEAAKVCLDDIVTHAGVTLQYFTKVLAPDRDADGTVRGLFLVSKDGLTYVRCATVVDCSGDADVVHRSGYETIKGRRESGKMTVATLIAFVENVDSAAIEAYFLEHQDIRFRDLVRRLRAAGEWPWPEDVIIVLPTLRSDVFFLNTNRQVGIDGTRASSLTQAMVDGRRYTADLLEKVLRPHYPGFANATLRSTAPMVGIRETRRIVGEYTLTEADCIEGTCFADTVALTGYGFDLPDPDRPSLQPFDSGNGGREVRMRKPYVEIPYRCLVPRGSRNLLAAGRCLSVDGQALGPTRVMAPCFAYGQAAGTAAAICADTHCTPVALDTTALRRRLLADGAILN